MGPKSHFQSTAVACFTVPISVPALSAPTLKERAGFCPSQISPEELAQCAATVVRAQHNPQGPPRRAFPTADAACAV